MVKAAAPSKCVRRAARATRKMQGPVTPPLLHPSVEQQVMSVVRLSVRGESEGECV